MFAGSEVRSSYQKKISLRLLIYICILIVLEDYCDLPQPWTQFELCINCLTCGYNMKCQ